MDVIILTGGMGTRLKSKIKDIPKTMASWNGVPFLERTINWLNKFEIQNVILAVGYKKEIIKNYFGNQYKNINIIYSEEETPLGTGGAIKQALEKTNQENVIVMNGDILARVELNSMYKKHLDSNATMTIAIKHMENFDRFGVIKFNKNRITEFLEKRYVESGYMNTGVYIMNKKIFDNKINDNVFSLENDYLNKYVSKDQIVPFIYDGSFIDIGIPEDYEKLQEIVDEL